jgi:spore coat protein JB
MNNQIEKIELLKQITALDFVIIDLHLYLNTHPTDGEALSKYNMLVAQAKGLKQTYEQMYGMIYAHGDRSPYPWQWINQPWPWEYEANFKLCGEEK